VIGADADLGLKWPNDLLLGGRKLAGVLAQRATDAVVVGLGLNVGWAPDGAASVAQVTGTPGAPHPAEVLRDVLDALDDLEGLDTGELTAAYRRDLHTIGQEVRVDLPDGSALRGRAVDVDAAGRLVVEASGRRHALDVGDVVHVRPA
jgi:BirA family biotin operon repressor/biotin-[acetyl-CoA-carboxylase] ligase